MDFLGTVVRRKLLCVFALRAGSKCVKARIS